MKVPDPRVFAICLALAGSLPACAESAPECTTPLAVGDWVHPRPKVGVISRLEIRHFCEPHKNYGHWKIRAFSKCSPRDCTWGWSAGQTEGRDQFYVGFQGFFGSRFINAKLVGRRMEVTVKIDHHDDRKADERYVVILERD